MHACVHVHACMRACVRSCVCVCQCVHAHTASLYWLKLHWGSLVICLLHALPGYSFSWHTRICIQTETKDHVCPFCWWQLRRNCMYNSKNIRWVSFWPNADWKMAKCTTLQVCVTGSYFCVCCCRYPETRVAQSLLQSVVALDARTQKPIFLFQRLRIHVDAQIDFCFLIMVSGIIQH